MLSLPGFLPPADLWVEEVYPGRVAAILGDDLLIADPKVGSIYESILSRLGLKISYQKSLISNTGSAEFAKKFRVKNLRLYFSPSLHQELTEVQPYGPLSISNR